MRAAAALLWALLVSTALAAPPGAGGGSGPRNDAVTVFDGESIASSATATSAWIDVERYATATVRVICSGNCTATAQFSVDGGTTNGGAFSIKDETTAADLYTLVVSGSDMRIAVTNTTASPITADVQLLRRIDSSIGVPSSRLGSSVGQFDSVLPVRVANDYVVDTAVGKIGDRSSVFTFGRNAVVDTNERLIWADGLGTYTAFAGLVATAAPVRIKAGGNVNDTAAGTGAREITFYCMAQDGTLWSEAEATAGASASTATSNSAVMCYRLRVSASGTAITPASGGANTGGIQIETTGGVKMGAIGAGRGTSEMAIYAVPTGYTFAIEAWRAFVDGSKSATIRLWIAEDWLDGLDGSPDYGNRYVLSTFQDLLGAREVAPKIPIAIPAGSLIWMTAQKDSAGTTTVEASFSGVLVKD